MESKSRKVLGYLKALEKADKTLRKLVPHEAVLESLRRKDNLAQAECIRRWDGLTGSQQGEVTLILRKREEVPGA